MNSIGKDALIHGVGVAVCLGLAVLAWVSLIQPAEVSRAAAEAARLDATQQAQDIAGAKQRLQDLLETQRDLAGAEANVIGRIDSSASLNATVAGLTLLSEEVGLEVRQVTPREPVALGFLMGVPIHLSLQGSFPSAVRLLSKLHAEHLAVGVSGLQFTRRGLNGEVEITLTLVWYYQA